MTDLLTLFFAKYFGYILIVLLLIFFACLAGRRARNYKKYLPLFWQMAAAAILSRGIITEVIRFFWQRSRPFVEQNIAPLVEHSASASFPSGHASFYFAIGTVLYFYNKKAGIIFLLGATLMGIARIAAGLHWPSDVIGGAFIGIFSALVVHKLFLIIRAKVLNKGE